jgi:predicted N-acetyltransferase YhbS
MKSQSIAHQFEFWTRLGQAGNYMHQSDGYSVLLPQKGAWPSKIFNLQHANITKLKHAILEDNLPNAIAVDSEDQVNQFLLTNGFKKVSTVEGMSLKVSSEINVEESSTIIQVENAEEYQIFAKIAAEAFGYHIHNSTIASLQKNEDIQLYLGKHKDQFVSCGILFLDKKGDAGLHMIGANTHFRGLGLGKEMTQHLLCKAVKNQPSNIHLVASKYGAPIYKKYGFLNDGYLNSYALNILE